MRMHLDEEIRNHVEQAALLGDIRRRVRYAG
jgi:hypothetical protein